MRIKRLLFLAVLAAFVIAMAQTGCDELITERTTVIEAGHPIADFDLLYPANGFGCVPCTAIFADHSDGPRQIYVWNFGDNTIVTETLPPNLADYTSPQHVYLQPGIYTVSLTIRDTVTDGQDTQIHPRFIYVGSIAADFDVNPSVACVGEEIDFVLHEYSNQNTYKWVFGDGTDTVTGLNPSHVYEAEGIYSCTLIAEDDCGQNIGVRDVEVTPCPDVSFAVDLMEGCAPLEVAFTNATNLFGQALVSYTWNFGDGQTSSDRDPIHTYSTGGVYDVSLTVTTSGGTSTLEMPDYITADADIIATFDIEGDSSFCYSLTQDFQVNFLNQSTGTLDSVRWYFGDGATSASDNPIHIYDTPGIYTVTLEAYGLCGADTLVSDGYIVLSDLLLPENILIDTTYLSPVGTVPAELTITDASTVGFVTHRTWYINDVVVPTAIDLEQFDHTFSDPGTYTVKLVQSNDCGTAENTIDIVIDLP